MKKIISFFKRPDSFTDLCTIVVASIIIFSILFVLTWFLLSYLVMGLILIFPSSATFLFKIFIPFEYIADVFAPIFCLLGMTCTWR